MKIKFNFCQTIYDKSLRCLLDFNYVESELMICRGRMVYECNVDFIQKNDYNKLRPYLAICNTTLGFLLFQFVNPFLSIVPIWLAGGQISVFYSYNIFHDNQIKLIQMNEDFQKLEIQYQKFNDNELSIIYVDFDKIYFNEDQLSIVSNLYNFIILFDCEDGKQHKKLQLIMNPSLMKINNPNLLRSVLYGDASEISKLKFI